MTSPVQEIKGRLDIIDILGEYLKLRKVGAGYQALCPFHNEKTPSFYISPERQTYKCFGCGAYGDIFSFMMEIEGIDFKEALHLLARRAGVEISPAHTQLRSEQKALYDVCNKSAEFFVNQLESEVGQRAKEYLIKRGISEESIANWRIGYAPEKWTALLDDLQDKGFKKEVILAAGMAVKHPEKQTVYDRFRGRIMFPIANLQGQIIGFGGRVFEGDEESAKYINSPQTLIYDKSKAIYGLDKAKLAIREKGQIILSEGYTDVIMSHQSGFTQTVATSGTALTQGQLSILKRYSENILMAFDMDSAGNMATQRAIALAQEEGFLVKVVTMEVGLDPAEMILKSPEEWSGRIEKAKSVLDFYFELAFRDNDPKTPEGRRQIARLILPLLGSLSDRIEQSHWVQELSRRLKADEKDIWAEVERIGKTEPESAPESAVRKPRALTQDHLSRKDRLERRIVGMLLLDQKYHCLVDKEDKKLFSQWAHDIIDCLADETLEEKRKASRNLDNLINVLALEIEADQVSVDQEMAVCLGELKRMIIQEKMRGLTEQIAQAERDQKPKKAQLLMKELHQLSQDLFNNGHQKENPKKEDSPREKA
jgi:DNA primase